MIKFEGAGAGGNGIMNVPVPPASADGKMGLLLLCVLDAAVVLSKARGNLWNDLCSFHWKDMSNSKPLTAISEGPLINSGANKGTSLGKYFWFLPNFASAYPSVFITSKLQLCQIRNFTYPLPQQLHLPCTVVQTRVGTEQFQLKDLVIWQPHGTGKLLKCCNSLPFQEAFLSQATLTTAHFFHFQMILLTFGSFPALSSLQKQSETNKLGKNL